MTEKSLGQKLHEAWIEWEMTVARANGMPLRPTNRWEDLPAYMQYYWENMAAKWMVVFAKMFGE